MPSAIQNNTKQPTLTRALQADGSEDVIKATRSPSSGNGTQLTGKVFMNGRSQAVRLPAQFRVSSRELYVRRDPHSGDLILSERPHAKRSPAEILDDIDALGGVGSVLDGIDRQPSSKIDLDVDL